MVCGNLLVRLAYETLAPFGGYVTSAC